MKQIITLDENDLKVFFEKIYYVNVDKHTERNENFRSRFSKKLLNSGFIERINAIKPGDTSNVYSYDNKFLTDKIRKNAMSNIKDHWAHKMSDIEMRHLYEVCCAMSHAETLSAIVANFQTSNAQQHICLVMEDDSVIEYNNFHMHDALRIQEEEFDICYAGAILFNDDLSGWLTEREYHIECTLEKNDSQLLFNANSGFFGTHGYIVKINKYNVDKFLQLIETLNSGVIADFCLSSQHYLVKKTVQNFFVNVSSKETSTIDTSYDNSLKAVTNQNLFHRGLIQNFNTYQVNPFNNRHDSGKQTWLFFKENGMENFVKEKFDKSDSENKLIEELIRNMYENHKKIKTAYILYYHDLSRPWYGTKQYLIKNSEWVVEGAIKYF